MKYRGKVIYKTTLRIKGLDSATRKRHNYSSCFRMIICTLGLKFIESSIVATLSLVSSDLVLADFIPIRCFLVRTGNLIE